VTVNFMVTGNSDDAIPVRYSGILPDLFVEGSGVVAEGSLGPNGVFMATNLLAKHDENYVPRELEGMGTSQAAKIAEQTTVGLN
jgi:cytochrome c-type biogenesis protein CcmE